MTTSGGRRDLDALEHGIVAWCQRFRPEVVAHGLDGLVHPSAGLSNETIIVRGRPDPAAPHDPAHPAPVGPRLVLRLAPVHDSFPDHDFGAQARVQQAVAQAGVPTPTPLTLVTDPSWLGAPFIVMPFVEGVIPGPASLFDPWLTEATPAQRRDAQSEMVQVMAAIHRLDWEGAGLDWLRTGRGSLDDHLATWTSYLHWAAVDQDVPRVEAILAWCRAHRPAGDPAPSLLWGDPRLENLVMTEGRTTRAVLDWDLATIGPGEMDLGWYLGLEQVLYDLTGLAPLEGFASAEQVAAEYQAARDERSRIWPGTRSSRWPARSASTCARPTSRRGPGSATPWPRATPTP